MNIFGRIKKAYYGWRVLGASCAVGSLGAGLTNYGFSVFFLPISQALGLNYTQTSLVFSLSRTEGAIEGPFAGYFIDRLGPRKVLFIAGTMMGIGWVLLSQVNSYPWFLVVYMGIISIGYNAGIIHAPMAMANSWFVRKRGLATGVLSASFGLGGAIIPPVLSWAIRNYGWQNAALYSGIAVIIVVVPMSFVFRRSPESMGLLPDGDTLEMRANLKLKSVSVETETDFTVKEAMRTSTFWILAVAICLRIAAYIGITVHFVPLMVWKGTSEATGAILLGAIALMTVPLRLFLGWTGDRVPRRFIIAVGNLVGAVGLLLLHFAGPGWQLWAFVVLFTFPESVGPIAWNLLADFYGRTRFASIRGIMSGFTGVAGAAMPVLAGYLWDKTKSYEITIWIMLVILTLSGLVFIVLRPPRLPARLKNPTPADTSLKPAN